MTDRTFALGRWYRLREHIPLEMGDLCLAEAHEDNGRVWATFVRPDLQEWMKRR